MVYSVLFRGQFRDRILCDQVLIYAATDVDVTLRIFSLKIMTLVFPSKSSVSVCTLFPEAFLQSYVQGRHVVPGN